MHKPARVSLPLKLGSTTQMESRHRRLLWQSKTCDPGDWYVSCNAPILCPSPFTGCRSDGQEFCAKAYNMCVDYSGDCGSSDGNLRQLLSVRFNASQGGKQLRGDVFCDPGPEKGLIRSIGRSLAQEEAGIVRIAENSSCPGMTIAPSKGRCEMCWNQPGCICRLCNVYLG